MSRDALKAGNDHVILPEDRRQMSLTKNSGLTENVLFASVVQASVLAGGSSLRYVLAGNAVNTADWHQRRLRDTVLVARRFVNLANDDNLLSLYTIPFRVTGLVEALSTTEATELFVRLPSHVKCLGTGIVFVTVSNIFIKIVHFEY